MKEFFKKAAHPFLCYTLAFLLFLCITLYSVLEITSYSFSGANVPFIFIAILLGLLCVSIAKKSRTGALGALTAVTAVFIVYFAGEASFFAYISASVPAAAVFQSFDSFLTILMIFSFAIEALGIVLGGLGFIISKYYLLKNETMVNISSWVFIIAAFFGIISLIVYTILGGLDFNWFQIFYFISGILFPIMILFTAGYTESLDRSRD